MNKNVSIIGRPNVGKSMLLNRLLGDQKVVTSDIAGTTRDFVEHIVEWQGSEFIAIDTGGITDELSSSIDESVQRTIQSVIKRSDLVLFMVDIRTGVTEEDLVIARMLQGADVPVIVAANKADSAKFDTDMYVFSSLGFDDIYPISSVSGIGVGDLLDGVVLKLKLDKTSSEDEVSEKHIAFGLFGKQNAGKSSLLNALLDEERVIVSDVPGTTIDPIKAQFSALEHDFTVIDTAGLRRRAKIIGDIETTSTRQSIKQLKDVSVACLVIDGSTRFTRQDARIGQTISNYFLPAMIIVTKLDLASESMNESDVSAFTDEYFEYLRSKLSQLYYAPIVFVSSQEKFNIPAVAEKLVALHERVHDTITQEMLDTFLQEYIAEYPPRGKRTRTNPRISRLTLHNRNPFIFQLKMSQKGFLAKSYLDHMTKSLHKYLNLEGWPLSIKRV